MDIQADRSSPQSGPTLMKQTFRGVLMVSLVSVIAATLFTSLPASGISLGKSVIDSSSPGSSVLLTPTAEIQFHVGLVVGHWGHDVGAICPDSLGGHREVDINYTIADLTRQYLEAENVQVDLLKEFDSRLEGYQGSALISIHADTCDYIPEQGTGFKIAEAVDNKRPEQAARLMACLQNRYGNLTNLRYDHRLTPDMTSYHAFGEINPNTPAVIIETGYMNQDRELLTQQPSLVARGITEGIMCYLNRERITLD